MARNKNEIHCKFDPEFMKTLKELKKVHNVDSDAAIIRRAIITLQVLEDLENKGEVAVVGASSELFSAISTQFPEHTFKLILPKGE